MVMRITTPSVAVSASTSSASAALPNSSGAYIRATNASTTSGAYVNAGGSGVTATNANVMLAPFQSIILQRDPNTETHVAALLISGNAIVSFTPCGKDYD